MKYLSIDLETTGLDPSYCQILEIGAIVDDTDWPEKTKNWNRIEFGSRPFFHCYVVHEKIIGQPYGLMMNAAIIEKIAKRKDFPTLNFYTPEDAVQRFETFMYEHFPSRDFKKVTVAGKNFSSFDRNFLLQLPNGGNLVSRFHHRVIDPAPLYFDPTSDTELPSLDKCLERAGIEGRVTHTACEDAYQVVQVIRKKYRG